MNKSDRAEMLNEMQRLYFEEDLTLEQIADHYGVTRQAVHERFTRNGVKLHTDRKKPRIKVDKKALIELYENEKLPVMEVAKYLKVSYAVLQRELARHNIKIRRHGELNRKYAAIDKLKIGDKLIIKRPLVKQPFNVLYTSAKIAGIRISIKSVDKENLQITRVE